MASTCYLFFFSYSNAVHIVFTATPQTATSQHPQGCTTITNIQDYQPQGTDLSVEYVYCCLTLEYHFSISVLDMLNHLFYFCCSKIIWYARLFLESSACRLAQRLFLFLHSDLVSPHAPSATRCAQDSRSKQQLLQGLCLKPTLEETIGYRCLPTPKKRVSRNKELASWVV